MMKFSSIKPSISIKIIKLRYLLGLETFIIPQTDASNTPAPSARTIVKQGTYGGKPVVQYSDGSVEYK